MYVKLFEELLKRQVDFILLGGGAVCIHGYPRMTEDIDILVANNPANLSRLRQVLARWESGAGRNITDEEFQGPGALRLIEDFSLDIYTELNGKPYEHYARNAFLQSFPFGDVPVFSIEDLIEAKKNTHREKDRLDVMALQRKLGPPLATDSIPEIILEPPPA